MDNTKKRQWKDIFLKIYWSFLTIIIIVLFIAMISGLPKVEIATTALLIIHFTIWGLITYMLINEEKAESAKSKSNKSNSSQPTVSNKDGWHPLHWLIYKEIIVIIAVFVTYNYGNRNGEFSLAVYSGALALVAGLIFNILAFTKSARKLWQISFIIFTIFCNVLIIIIPSFFH